MLILILLKGFKSLNFENLVMVET